MLHPVVEGVKPREWARAPCHSFRGEADFFKETARDYVFHDTSLEVLLTAAIVPSSGGFRPLGEPVARPLE